MNIADQTMQKEKHLEKILKNLQRPIVAFSGGLDSSYLLYKTTKAVGRENVLAVTVNSEFYQPAELEQARSFVKKLNIQHRVIFTNHLDDDKIRTNPPDRCFYCKRKAYSMLAALAAEENYDRVLDGSNQDDLADYRPGLLAVEKLGIASPLRMVGLMKEEISSLSKKNGLETWNSLSGSCLASRFPYGEEITLAGLKRVREGEMYLRNLGLKGDLRVRSHGHIARIEVTPQDASLIYTNRLKIAEKYLSIGFKYATFDLTGFCSGSMNLLLDD